MLKIKKIESRYLRSNYIIEIIVSIVAGLSAFIWTPIITSEDTIRDSKFRLRASYQRFRCGPGNDQPGCQPDETIVIITVTENVMARYGLFYPPRVTPRDYLARLIDSLSEYGPKVIAVDYILDYPSPGNSSADRQLLASIKKSGRVITGYQKYVSIHNEINSMTETQRDYLEASLAGGYFNIPLEKDNTVRNYQFTKDNYPSFGYQIVAAYMGFLDGVPPLDQGLPARTVEKVKKSMMLKGIPAGLYNSETALNFTRPPGEAFTVYDSDLFAAGEKGLRDFAGRNIRDSIVIIGDGTYRTDLHRTPFTEDGGQADMNGVFIHAYAVKNILDRNQVTELSGLGLFLLLAALLLLTAAAAFSLRFMRGLLLLTAIICAYHAASVWIFISSSISLPAAAPSAVVFITFIAVIVFRIAFSEKDNIDADENLSKNIPVPVLKRLHEESIDSIFTPRSEDISVMVCLPKNIPDVTSGIAPEKINEFINYYYRILNDCVFAHGGVFNRIPLNGVMAFWNSPIHDADAPAKALAAAADIIDMLELINRKGKKISGGFVPVCIDITLHSGSAMTGYFGPEGNRDYTAAGRTVNEAFETSFAVSRDEESWILCTAEFMSTLTGNPPESEEISVDGKKFYRIINVLEVPHV